MAKYNANQHTTESAVIINMNGRILFWKFYMLYTYKKLHGMIILTVLTVSSWWKLIIEMDKEPQLFWK